MLEAEKSTHEQNCHAGKHLDSGDAMGGGIAWA
jgi:hypothetical protein